MNRSPTPGGVFATNFVGECHQFAERSLRYSNSCGVGDRFIAPVFLHNQICIFTSSNTCFRFNAHTFPHYRIRIFISPNMYIHITAHAYPHYRIRVFTLLNTHFHTIARTFPPPFLWVNTDMRAR